MKTTKARSVWPLLLWAELLVLGKPIVFSFLPAERKAIKSDSTFRFPSPPSPEEFVVIIVVVLLHSRSVGGILKWWCYWSWWLCAWLGCSHICPRHFYPILYHFWTWNMENISAPQTAHFPVGISSTLAHQITSMSHIQTTNVSLLTLFHITKKRVGWWWLFVWWKKWRSDFLALSLSPSTYN